LARVGRRLAVVQDDALFVALVDPAAGSVGVISLPAATDGLRCFDRTRGNKAAKPDLEACVVVGGRLFAFGSGSTAARERVVVVRGIDASVQDTASPTVEIVEASRLYAALRAAPGFAGSELNLEGAVVMGGRVRLFQRGNGAPRGAVLPVDATCELDLADLLRYLEGGDALAPPPVRDVVQYDLGTVNGVRLTFTDAAALGEDTLFLAAAEDSPDTVRDGPVVGVAVGVIREATGEACWTLLLDQDGQAFTGKAEGLATDALDPRTIHLVVDRDDPSVPAELCRVEIAGFR
jgi:hypothetical protein